MKHVCRIIQILLITLAIKPPLAAQPGNEQLVFDLRFGIIKGGEAVYTVKDTIVNNQHALYAFLRGNTTGLTDLIYAVNDQYSSLLHKESFLPMWSTKKLSEQKFRFNEQITYNQQHGEIISNHLGKKEVAQNICDLSALMYHFRFSGQINRLEEDEVLHIPFWDTNEWYYLDIKYAGKEQIKTKLGKFNCLRFEPQHVSGRFFNRKNPMNIWITNDARRLPVLMELNFTIGSVKCELIDT